MRPPGAGIWGHLGILPATVSANTTNMTSVKRKVHDDAQFPCVSSCSPSGLYPKELSEAPSGRVNDTLYVAFPSFPSGFQIAQDGK